MVFSLLPDMLLRVGPDWDAISSPIRKSNGDYAWVYSVSIVQKESVRLLTFVTVFAPLALLIGSPKLPESPRYLIKEKRHDEALQLLCKLHHSPEDPNDTLAHEEALQIKTQLQAEEQMPQGFLAVMKVASYRKRFLIGIGVQ